MPLIFFNYFFQVIRAVINVERLVIFLENAHRQEVGMFVYSAVKCVKHGCVFLKGATSLFVYFEKDS